MTTRSIISNTYRVNYDYTVSPSLLLHAGAGMVTYTTEGFACSAVNGYDSANELGLPGAVAPGFPTFSFGSATIRRQGRQLSSIRSTIRACTRLRGRLANAAATSASSGRALPIRI